MAHIAVIGEAVADALLPPGQDARAGILDLRVRPGGSPVNTAVALGRLGTPTLFFGRLASGPFGELFREHLRGSRVDLSGCVSAAEQATLAVAAIDARGQAAYEFYADGTADWQWTREELFGRVPAGVSCVHTGSLALALEPGGPLIEELLQALRPQSTISIDPNLRPRLIPPQTYRNRIRRWAGLADLLRLSDEDLGNLCPGAEAERVCDEWHDEGVRLVIITQGAEGALASLDGTRITVPAVEIEPVDTVGAGDAFTAGLLHYLAQGGHLGGRLTGLTAEDVREAMAFGARVAAQTCTVAGADPPWGDLLA
jgi:fructokinase